VDSGGIIGYVGVCGQWWPYWLSRCMWTVVSLLAILVYVDSGGLIDYIAVCGQWCLYWLCRCIWAEVTLLAM
jgi:hypothetical protein